MEEYKLMDSVLFALMASSGQEFHVNAHLDKKIKMEGASNNVHKVNLLMPTDSAIFVW